MSRSMKSLVVIAGLLMIVSPIVAEEPQEPEKPSGAKALFGEGNEEIFFPRQGEGGGSAEMDPEKQVTEEMLTSFYKKPEFSGIAYSLEVIRAGEKHITTVDDPRRWEFRTGDRMRLRLVPNFTGFAYVLEAKGSDASLVYPVRYGTEENMVKAGRECYVPVTGWLRLVDPAVPFTMRVLFKPGAADYPLNQPTPNAAVARVGLTEAIHREWQTLAGQKGMMFESDRSYVEAGGPASAGAAPTQGDTVVDETSYTTNYVVVDQRHRQSGAGGGMGEPAIAIEVPIRHVGR